MSSKLAKDNNLSKNIIAFSQKEFPGFKEANFLGGFSHQLFFLQVKLLYLSLSSE
jgi:hypothetical protein